MVDFDLSELSAPIEALRSDVQAAYKRLDTKWSDIAKTLSKLPIPRDVCYAYYEHPDFYPDCLCLEWRKWKGSKRICIVSYSYEQISHDEHDALADVTPYEEWSTEQRIEMLKYVPQLFEAATKQTKKFIESTKY